MHPNRFFALRVFEDVDGVVGVCVDGREEGAGGVGADGD